MKESERATLRRLVKYFYDLQRLRIQVAGRTKATSIELDKADLDLLQAHADRLSTLEKAAFKDIKGILASIPFYKDVLSDKTRYRGVGPTLAAIILSEFDIHRAKTASVFKAYAGLAPVPAQRCKHCFTVVRDSSGVCSNKRCGQPTTETIESSQSAKPRKGEKNTYNSFLRAKLLGVLAEVLIKVGSPWRRYYDNYKHRKKTAGWGISDAHRHRAACRYMVSMLLEDIWREWRQHENLPIRPSYHEEYQQGHGYTGDGVGADPYDYVKDAEINSAIAEITDDAQDDINANG